VALNFDAIKSRLLRLPGASHAKEMMIKQGHTEAEAEAGGLLAAGLIVFLAILLFNTFLVGMIRVYFNNFWTYAQENPAPAAFIAFLGTVIFVGVFLRFASQKEEKKKKEDFEARQRRHGQFRGSFPVLCGKEDPGPGNQVDPRDRHRASGPLHGQALQH
jgi:hypothetical protein